MLDVQKTVAVEDSNGMVKEEGAGNSIKVQHVQQMVCYVGVLMHGGGYRHALNKVLCMS